MTDDSGVVLVCEHASAVFPDGLDDLGLNAEARVSHAAWDLGASEIAHAMRAALNAPLVEAVVSRLIYDCNRPPQAETAVPTRSERFDIPGNVGLSASARGARVAEVYYPFHTTLSEVIDAQRIPPAIVTIHTFTPVYNGTVRDTEIGFLHDTDPVLAERMVTVASRHTNLDVVLNQPYGMADGVTHTLARHGVAKGLRNVMIEVRNDLVATPQAAADVGRALAGMVQDALEAL